MTFANVLLLAIFGGLGAAVRYVTSTALSREFPVGTWVVNILGSFLLGYLAALTANAALDEQWLLILGTGFCGGFTTFSTASLETFQLWRDGRHWQAIANFALMALVCVAAAGRGWVLGSL